MIIVSLWNYLRGYVIIKIEGLALERFINTCIGEQIYLWDIKRINYTTLEAKVGLRGFRQMRKIVKKTGCKVYISNKSGYPFWYSKVKKRKMLFFGAFFSLIFITIISSFIFKIEVIGNEKISDEEIYAVLKESGLKIGKNKYQMDIRSIENDLLLNIENLAWAGVDIKGTTARVEIVERTETPIQIDKETPCNVVASKNGVIKSVIARNGESIVSEGDIVRPGDIIISGIIERETLEEPVLVHAYGEVYAKTYYETTKFMKLIETKKQKTGEKISRRTIKLGDMSLAISRGNIPYDTFIVEKNAKRPLSWRNLSIPVEIITEEYYEATETKEELDINVAKADLHEKAVRELVKEIPEDAELLDSIISFEQKNNVLYIDLIIETLEEIGKKSALVEKDYEEDNT
ncbi:sporulation protein YqfD [Serpentinicella sp. ANB-PHB4]|uniref:sporulation protein YqfD n=1 Tax=Serpentinicella sp. ANB-PHB4 TaxID=3074076 RepID=UPI002865F62E|nr:sporulation protein YqfD [Serpentinicella sp. ANB-PHB4]MDR5657982.1 sporulation protein YqfD [Serpentinicella sp. ANB-PHB4]